jgi:UDP-glucose 4-epimerase
MSQSNIKKAVVFGGSGFLGSYIADELEKCNYEVVVADIFPSKYLSRTQSYERCDIQDLSLVKQLIDNDTEVVYNLAAFADINKAIDDPVTTMRLNVMGNLNILEACRHRHIKRFIFASSVYAFSDKGSFYGISKHTSEKLVEEYGRRYNMPFTIIRYGSLYGERAKEDNFINQILKEAIFKQKLIMHGTGKEIREYVHAKDAAMLSVDILENDKYNNQILVLTGVERMNRNDLFIMIREIFDNTIEIQRIGSSYKGHYEITPYIYHPGTAKKLVANPYIDMGQGLVNCIKSIVADSGDNGDGF